MLHILNILEKCCILEKSRKKLVTFGENSAKFSQILRNFGEKTAKNSAIFNENFEIRERCKGVHCVDLGESFPTSIYLQNLASIQPRTSPKKFGKTGKRDFEISFALTPVRAFEIEGQIYICADPRLGLARKNMPSYPI